MDLAESAVPLEIIHPRHCCTMPAGLARYHHYATGYRGTVEIESEWTAARRKRANP